MGNEGIAQEKEGTASRVEKQKDVEKEKLIKTYAQKRIGFLLLKVVLFMIAIVVSLVVGTIIGYSVIGKGPVSEVFDIETWKHILSLMGRGN